MPRLDRHEIALAIGLAALAGYVDALGFISLGGFFVSFMSGNSTRLAVGLSQGNMAFAATAGGLIFLFVLGVIAGSCAGRATKRRWAVLGVVALLSAIAAAIHASGRDHAAAFVMAVAMGAVNATFERDGDISIGLTYMTGTLAKIGQRIAAIFWGGAALAFLPYLLLWLGLVCGAVAGAALYGASGLDGLWLAPPCALVLMLAARAHETRR